MNRNLESRVVELALAKLSESVTDFPFVDSLAGLDELIELVSNGHLRPTFLEELGVKRFLQVLLRPLRHALRAPQLQQCHLGFQVSGSELTMVWVFYGFSEKLDQKLKP